MNENISIVLFVAFIICTGTAVTLITINDEHVILAAPQEFSLPSGAQWIIKPMALPESGVINHALINHALIARESLEGEVTATFVVDGRKGVLEYTIYALDKEGAQTPHWRRAFDTKSQSFTFYVFDFYQKDRRVEKIGVARK
jgi:hypothetical protein